MKQVMEKGKLSGVGDAAMAKEAIKKGFTKTETAKHLNEETEVVL